MEATLKNDAKVLIPNSEHKNFTETNEVLSKGTKVSGQPKNIQGLRRGEPFTYRLFLTNNNQLIHLNNLENMNATEVKLGADATVTSTKVDLIPAETFNKIRRNGLIIGAVAGFAWAKYKKHDIKKVGMWIGVGALVGYAAAYVIDTNRKAIVKPSK
jgi:hypothetical protein